MVIKRPTEKTRPDGITHRAPFFCLEFKVSLVRAEFHRLTSAVEFKRPSAGLNSSFELKLTGEAWADGTDAFCRFMALAVGVNHDCLKPADGDG